MGLLLLYLFIAIFFSFMCSIMEAVLLSVTPSYVSIKIKENNKIGNDLQAFKDNIDRPLAAILTLNTFAHTIGAAGVGVQAQKIWGEEYLSVVSAVLTIIILILSEIIPKTLGATYWKKLAPATVRILKVLIYSPLYPFIWVSQLITKGMSKNKKSILSRADFTAMAEMGFKEGIFREHESKIIKNLVRFNNIFVKDIMTPRTVVVAAPQNLTVREFYDKVKEMRFSRIPVYDEKIDDVTGFVLKDDILQQVIEHEGDKQLEAIKREIMVVHDTLPIPELFNRLMEKKEHIAMVVDEYGGLAGVVSMEDVIETLLGMEIMDEFDKIEDMQMMARKSWERRAKRLGILTDEEVREQQEQMKSENQEEEKQ